MPRWYSLLKLGQMSVPRLMAEDLTPAVDKAAVGRLGRGPAPTPVGYVKLSSALLPGLRSRDLPTEEAPARANIAVNQFLACTGMSILVNTSEWNGGSTLRPTHGGEE